MDTSIVAKDSKKRAEHCLEQTHKWFNATVGASVIFGLLAGGALFVIARWGGLPLEATIALASAAIVIGVGLTIADALRPLVNRATFTDITSAQIEIEIGKLHRRIEGLELALDRLRQAQNADSKPLKTR
jgi:hypothetical protein